MSGAIGTRPRIIAANWKMNKVPSEARAFAVQLLSQLATLGPPPGVEVVICPPFPALEAVGEEIRRSGLGGWVHLGAQNLHWEPHGAFTGEVSGAMLADVGCRYVIVGHSERRHLFGEADDAAARKVRAALGYGLTPILCVGETLEERRRRQTEAVVRRQLDAALQNGPGDFAGRIVVAYEPVWAIGTGENATGEEANRVIDGVIRARIRELAGPDAADKTPIQYGGSVSPANIGEFMAYPAIDGALVGGASLKVESFAAIVAAGRR
ncbi:MAG: triose-phosphate isomerase [Bacillota bacterium]